MKCSQCPGDFTATYGIGDVQLCRECYFAPIRGPAVVRKPSVRTTSNKTRQGSH